MAKFTIMERTNSFAKTMSDEPFDKLVGDDEVEGKAGFETSNDGARARLRMLVEHQRRSRPALSEAEAVAAGWRALGYADRKALLHEDDDGQDVTFDPENVDVEKLADVLLEIRAELIGKARGLTREQAMAAAIDERPDIFSIARETKRAKLVAGNADDAAAIAKRLYATQLLTKHAEELRKAAPTLSIEAARIEARARWPDVAARERA
jgi:hypothetical protein